MPHKENAGASRAKAIAGGVAGLMLGGLTLLGWISEPLRRQAAGLPAIESSDIVVLGFAFGLLFLGLRSLWLGARMSAAHRRDA